MPWLSEMYPELDKYKLSGEARRLIREGWDVQKRWDPVRGRTYSWAEPPEGVKVEQPKTELINEVAKAVAKEFSEEKPEEKVDVVDSSALENALASFFEELVHLRVKNSEKDKRIAELEKLLERVAKESDILKDENSKLRSYGLTTIGITPTMKKILAEFRKA